MQESDAGTVKRQAVAHGMNTLREDGRTKIREGLTSADEVLRVTQMDLD